MTSFFLELLLAAIFNGGIGRLTCFRNTTQLAEKKGLFGGRLTLTKLNLFPSANYFCSFFAYMVIIKTQNR